jgi:hypothetical protein
METPEPRSIIQMRRDVFLPETLNVRDVSIAKEQSRNLTDIEGQGLVHHAEACQGHVLICFVYVDVKIFVIVRITQEVMIRQVEKHNWLIVTVCAAEE